MSITAKRQAIATWYDAVTGIASSPTTVTKIGLVSQLPAALTRFVKPTQEVFETGGGTENTWTFATDLIVAATNEDTATTTLETLVDAVLDRHRTDPTIGGIFVDSRIEGDEPYVVEADEDSANAVPLLVSRITITGQTDED